MRYSYDWQGAVYASMSMLNLPQSLEFTPPCTFSPARASATNDASERQVLQGLWWKHLDSLDGFVALANTTDKPLAVSVRATGAQQATNITLPPHGASLRRLPEVLLQMPSQAARAGGIEISYTGRLGDLQTAGGLEDPAKGFSVDLPFVMQEAAQGPPAQQRYAAVGVMLGQQQDDLNFPAGVSFSPFAVFRNLASSPRQLRFEVYYMEGARTVGSLPLAPLTLEAGGAAELPLSRLAGALAHVEALNLAYSYQGSPGDILASIGSTDQTGSYVFPVRAEPVGPSGSKTSVYWQVSNGFDSMYTLWNPGLTDADVLFTLRYDNGTKLYEMPVHLVPHESAMIDIGELARERIPDFQGRLLPLSPIEGSLLVSGPQNGPEDLIDVVLAEGIYNPRKATCGGGCVTCNGWTSPCFDPVTGFLVPPAGSQQGQLCYNFYDGWVYWITGSSNWWSGNTSVATVQTHGQGSPGLTTGVGPGSTYISAQSISWIPVNAGQICSSEPIACPSAQVGSGSTVSVTCATPVNFHQDSVTKQSDGTLVFLYRFASSTGNPSDLSACTVGETVFYPGNGPEYVWPLPMVSRTQNPFPRSSSGNNTVMIDNNSPPTSYQPPYYTVSFDATQRLWWMCPCYQNGDIQNFVPDITITRRVSNDDADHLWKYRISKSGETNTVLLP